MTTSRYTTASPWRITERIAVSTPRGTATLIHEVADLAETASGYVFTEGCHRVRIEAPGTGWPRAKSWRGESAWSAAQRHLNDLRWSLERG